MSIWGAIAVIGLLTFALRVSFLARGRAGTFSPLAQQALRYVPVAVLAALILPALLLPAGGSDLSPGTARLFAGLLAGAVAWRTGNALLTVGAGMAALWVVQALPP